MDKELDDDIPTKGRIVMLIYIDPKTGSSDHACAKWNGEEFSICWGDYPTSVSKESVSYWAYPPKSFEKVATKYIEDIEKIKQQAINEAK